MTETDSNPQSIVRNIRGDSATVILDLAGDIDLHTSIELRQKLLEILNGKPSIIVLNLAEVDFMDSSGLATLVEVLQLSRKAGGQVKLVALKQRVLNLLEISRLDTIFSIYPDESEALA